MAGKLGQDYGETLASFGDSRRDCVRVNCLGAIDLFISIVGPIVGFQVSGADSVHRSVL